MSRPKYTRDDVWELGHRTADGTLWLRVQLQRDDDGEPFAVWLNPQGHRVGTDFPNTAKLVARLVSTAIQDGSDLHRVLDAAEYNTDPGEVVCPESRIHGFPSLNVWHSLALLMASEVR